MPYDPKSKAFTDDIYVEIYSCLFNVYVRQDCFSFHFYEELVSGVLYYMQYFQYGNDNADIQFK